MIPQATSDAANPVSVRTFGAILRGRNSVNQFQNRTRNNRSHNDFVGDEYLYAAKLRRTLSLSIFVDRGCCDEVVGKGKMQKKLRPNQCPLNKVTWDAQARRNKVTSAMPLVLTALATFWFFTSLGESIASVCRVVTVMSSLPSQPPWP